MGTKGIEQHWHIMAEKTIYSTPEEWNKAREIMQQKIANGEKPPFKIQKDNDTLSHSFLVAVGENGQPLLGVLARGKDQKEGILGFGSYGMCKLILWEDGTKSAVKIEPDNQDKNELAIMAKLGLIRTLFTRSWEKRLADHAPKTEGNEQWISSKAIRNKIYKVMPLIEGIDLTQFLASHHKQGTMKAAQVIFTSVINQLMDKHAKGIFHNDLHPGNVMVDSNLNAFLIDWGKSVDLANKPITVKDIFNHLGQTLRLAPELMSFRNKTLIDRQTDPESIHQQAEIPFSAASDVYSLAFIFVELFHVMAKDQTVMNLRKSMMQTNPEDRILLKEILAIVNSSEFTRQIKYYDEKMISAKPGPALSLPNEVATPELINAYEDELKPPESPMQVTALGYDDSIDDTEKPQRPGQR